MRDLPLNALRVFALACTHGGVRAAARELGIAHSSVSRHLAELEAWLGVPLAREKGAGRRGWAPTPQGEALGKAVLAGLGDIEAAAMAVREARSPFAVTISSAPSFAARWLLPRLPALERAHPRIELAVLVNQHVEDLHADGIDLAIRMGTGPWPGLRCEALMDDALYPVMSPGLWKEVGRPARPQVLSSLRLLHDRDPHAGWERWRQRFGPASLNLQRGPRFASSDLLLRAAAQGQGVALVRHRLAADDVAAGLLVRPFGERELHIGNAYWIVHPDRAPRHAVATVIAWLKDRAGRG
ncbi:MAG: LysR family transcriptional regulator [Xanthomonadales bacterium]|nr:LysR family transcriptional regulator [Xanthomonadales bacterium]ODU92350.1 MAG: LysR family transcriptional regulator [Rhodanobacter sp. SCN 66-43]OJY85890.1 MAG: LysR family transcriptional regulator [Xanthomonadales bacterium 66-474]